MIWRVFLAIIVLVAPASPVAAHRLDEYLQAALVSVGGQRVVVRLSLTPGVAVVTKVMAGIDADGDGALSSEEKRIYADCVRRDLSLHIDGAAAPLRLSFFAYPSMAQLHNGAGDIIMTFIASLPSGSRHSIELENTHQRTNAVYLVNTLLPNDRNIRIIGQERSYDQSRYRLDFAVGSSGTDGSATAQSLVSRDDRRTLVRTYFWHGVEHILTGYDHLLFIAALVFGAAKLWDLVKVITLFTVAHSITLALASLGIVHLSSGIVEPIIAASIVAVALQNIFWPRQAPGGGRLLIAFVFGLFHGLGFASSLLEIMRAMPLATMLLAILGFSLGVEAGNQFVLLSLFGGLRIFEHGRLSSGRRVRQIGSGGVLAGGLYYLGSALLASG
jgi:hydrogenase/urease accessory protein HupE